MACEEWNLDEVQRIILLNNFNIDAFDDDHVTALQMAAATGNIGIVEYLLDNGADIEKSNQVGMTPLHHASRNGHTNVVRILVQRGANYHKLTYLGASAMTLAAAGGHLELVKLLLDLRVNVNPLHTALCPTPIIAAAFRRHTHICALLTHRGAYLDAHIQRLWNLSALSTAITCGAISVICALIELGANIQYRSLGGYNAIELAKLIHRYDALQIIEKSINTSLKEEKPVKVDIRARIAVRDENAIRIALRSGIRYTNTFPDGCTPLMYAVLLADSQIVKVILDEGSANIDAIENVSGLTALMFASIIGDSETIECLLNAGADTTIVSFEGFTAFDYALASGTVDTESLCLLERHMEHCFMASSSSLSSKNDIHQQLSRVIHSGKSKFLNRLSNHVGLSVSLGVNNNERKELLSNNFQYILHSITNAIQMDFQLANDLLRSQQQSLSPHFNNNINSNNNNNNNNKCDNLHNSIRIARFIAEQRVTQGLAPLPIAFVNDDSLQYDKYGNSIDSSISNKSSSQYTNEQRQKEYFSLAQRNADLFYEYRYPKTLESKKSILGGSNRNRLLLFDDDSRRKISSSTSASGSDAQSFFADKIMMIQNHNLFEHQQQQCSTNTLLGTTARVRLRYKDTMDMDNTNTNNIINDGDNNGDDDERSSPSRLSLNQYTFALKDDSVTLRKSRSTPMLDGLMCRSSSPISSLSSNCFHSTRHSARSAISTLEHARKRSSHSRLNEDSLWIKLRDNGLADYISLLKSEEIDKATFLALTNEDLIDLGISNTLHRHSLLKIAKNLRHS